MKAGVFPLLLATLCFALPGLRALDAPEAGASTPFHLLDSNGTGIAKASVVMAPSWRQMGKDRTRRSIDIKPEELTITPLPAGSSIAKDPDICEAKTDEEGRFASRVPKGDALLLIMHESGVAFFKEGDWPREGGDLRVQLQPWASLSGTVTSRDDKPAAGVLLSVYRNTTSVAIGSMISFYPPPITHGVLVRTDEKGRFNVPRLLPTGLDGGHDVPYSVYESVISGPQPEDAALKTLPSGPWGFLSGTATSINIGRGNVSLRPGEKATKSFAKAPRCDAEIRGRLVWPDGSAIRASDIKAGNAIDAALSFSPQMLGGWTGTIPRAALKPDGRFTASLPLAGSWQLQVEGLHGIGGKDGFDFRFSLPKADSVKGPVIELGDIVFQRPGKVATIPPKADADGSFETTFTVLDDKQHPLSGVRVRTTRLESNQPTLSRYHYPKNLPSTQTGTGGKARLKVPGTYLDEDGKQWKITHIEVEMTHEGFEPWTKKLTVGETGAVFAMKESRSVAVRVLKEGKAMPLERVQLGVGWTSYGWDVFEHPKWKEDHKKVFRRINVPAGVWQVQAGHLDDQQWRWFSQIVEIDSLKNGDPQQLNLRRGIRVSGQIDPEVPRPIMNGMVRVVVRMQSPSNDAAHTIWWSDWQKVNEEGSFEFRGLPPGDAWVAASCTGWISEHPTMESKRLSGDLNWSEPISMLWSAQPFVVEAKDTSVAVRMVRSGTAVFHFKSADGSALAKARVYWDPKIDLGPAREQLESTHRSLDLLLGNPDETSFSTGAFLPRCAQETDGTGTLRLENLPPTKLRLGLQIGSEHHWSDGQAHPYDSFAPFQADLKSGEVVEKDFTVAQSKAP